MLRFIPLFRPAPNWHFRLPRKFCSLSFKLSIVSMELTLPHCHRILCRATFFPACHLHPVSCDYGVQFPQLSSSSTCQPPWKEILAKNERGAKCNGMVRPQLHHQDECILLEAISPPVLNHPVVAVVPHLVLGTGTAHFERCLILRRFFCSRRVRFLEKVWLSGASYAHSTTNINKPWAVGRHKASCFFHFQRNLDRAWHAGTWIRNSSLHQCICQQL